MMFSMKSRRNFLLSAPAFALAARSALAGTRSLAEVSAQASRIYIGTNGDGIYTASWNAATGQIGAISLAAEVLKPTFLACHLRGAQTFIYAVTEAGESDSKVSAFTTQPGSAALKPLGSRTTLGSGPTHISVTPDGQSVFVANYGGGSVTSYHVQADGSLSAPVSHVQYTGSGPYPERQTAPHTHSVMPSLDGRFLLVNDLGLDRIMVYRIDAATATLTPSIPPFYTARKASGPRHLAWNPNGRLVYCSNELDSTVDVLAWNPNQGTLSLLQTISSLKDEFPKDKAFVGEIIASADGRNVYAGNRVADDTIAVFDVDRSTGRLARTQLAPSGGRNSRHIALDPSQRWLVISHQESNDLVVLERDAATGALSAPRHTYAQQKPMCVVFV